MRAAIYQQRIHFFGTKITQTIWRITEPTNHILFGSHQKQCGFILAHSYFYNVERYYKNGVCTPWVATRRVSGV